MSRADWPLDHALERLRVHRLPYVGDAQHLQTWHTVCPSCRWPGWGLTIREHGRGGEIDLRCAAGCPADAIREAMERGPADARIEAAELRASEALRIADDARAVAARAIEMLAEAEADRTPMAVAA